MWQPINTAPDDMPNPFTTSLDDPRMQKMICITLEMIEAGVRVYLSPERYESEGDFVERIFCTMLLSSSGIKTPDGLKMCGGETSSICEKPSHAGPAAMVDKEIRWCFRNADQMDWVGKYIFDIRSGNGDIGRDRLATPSPDVGVCHG